MGMAASQARYLALTARKTNTEYEGQQINQARTALANQSANLFNRLLDLKVPDPPKTTDYTKIQYSYSDGENASVIDEWTQVSGANPEYNYIVKSHYFANMYTGAMKKLTDPQVQIGGNGAALDSWNTIALNKQLVNAAEDAKNTAYGNLQKVTEKENIDILNIQTAAFVNNTKYNNVDSSINQYAVVQNPGYDEYTLTSTSGKNFTVKYFNNPDEVTTAQDSADIQSILQGVRDMIDTDITNLDKLNTKLVQYGIIIQDSNIDEITANLPVAPGDTYNDMQKALLNVFGLEENDNISRIVDMADVTAITSDDADGDGTTAHTHQLKGTFLANAADPTVPTLSSYATDIRDNHISNITNAELVYKNASDQYQALLDNYNNNITKPTYVGNCELTPLVDLTDDQKTELLQVVKDMKADKVNTDIVNCFDADNNYLGGVYSFKMNGTTYYTTQTNLEDAYYHSYPGNKSNNAIDAQYKMPYYNATYMDKRIEKQDYALLETDGNGRFKSVKFDNDSVVYALNTETVTDEAAYQDAMNRYNYERAVYEKTIADINARTSIIQKEDRTLELRLRQLDTEQKALSTEMEAVKKVIKDNIESTFKTFSD